MPRSATRLLTVISLSLAGCASIEPVTSEQAACSVATARVTGERRLPASHVAYCDHIPSTYVPTGYYVLGLWAHCRDQEGCGSTLMGWFAVRGATGEVFESEVGDWKLGRRVRAAR